MFSKLLLTTLPSSNPSMQNIGDTTIFTNSNTHSHHIKYFFYFTSFQQELTNFYHTFILFVFLTNHTTTYLKCGFCKTEHMVIFSEI